MKKTQIEFKGQIGRCGDREVFIGFGQAADLSRISSPDILDEVTGKGYQRRFHREHSLEFKRYIQQPGATTIPLTFNLRPDRKGWKLQHGANGATLVVDTAAEPVMAQVDCQHRLGYLRESQIPFAFMAYIGLSIEEEMEIFRVINGKAKGLSGSLLDFTEARLVENDLKAAKPELFLALMLHEDQRSPWYQRLDLGGNRTTGPLRVASLRTMQKAARRFLREAGLSNKDVGDHTAALLIDFWRAITVVLSKQWNQPRQNMLVKGIGVYCLMSLAGELYRESTHKRIVCDIDYFISALSDYVHRFDWSSKGPLKGFGGASGADAALALLRQIRANQLSGYMNHGKQEHPTH
ncbi:MAG: DGQHR domain-containing protein [Propionivibrio sp.]|nr:DGQHR domain-containing protein [Propionivibrio sp.]